MVNFDEIIDKANVKEFIAIVGGLVASKVIDSAMAKFDPDKRDAIKALGALGVTYFINDMAEKQPDKAELLGLAGLLTTTVGAVPVANRVSLQVLKFTGSPIKIVASSSNPNPQPVNVSASINPNPQPVSVSVSASAGSRRSVVASI